ncbi:MAG TPA: thymidine phosphorylase [Candidatus Acidoferrales bacterium]|nr:thymidine phosphorylase [Candidatus Acidoferrales bacterium]
MNGPDDSSAPGPIRAVDVIRGKRDGRELSSDEIDFIVRGYTSGHIPDYQVSAWLMAALLKGLSGAETAALTDSMLRSGQMLDLSEFSATKVDKHSTGGVGDKTSLVLAPLAAAGGLIVPMISGRSLGHTGGTLDKLEAIPGFNVRLDAAHFRDVLRACGCAMIGQTAEIAPADRRFYSLRDVTGTVESAPLICASIMSKKLAEGIDALVLDVKTGSGAFMKTEDEAAFLAERMVETGQRMGKRVVALITDMDQPLGLCVGNSLEVQEALEVLHGQGAEDLRQLCGELAAWMFFLGGRADTVALGRNLANELIGSGQALEKFRRMVASQGGDPRVIDDPGRLPRAKFSLDVVSPRSGFVGAIQCEAVGTACVILGGGRAKMDDAIDPAVGIVLHKKVADPVSAGETLCTISYNSEARAAEAKRLLVRSYHIADAPPASKTLVRRIVPAVGVAPSAAAPPDMGGV